MKVACTVHYHRGAPPRETEEYQTMPTASLVGRLSTGRIACWGLCFSVLLIVGSWAAAETYGFVTAWGSFGAGNGQFFGPAGVAVDAVGNVYVTDNGNHRVQKFRSNGTYVTRWGTGKGSSPWGVAVDASGYVYVACNSTARIRVFQADGTPVGGWGVWGHGEGQIDTPTGVAVDTAGNVYVADMGNDRIEKFTSDGTYLTQWSRWPGDGLVYPEGVAVGASGSVYVEDTSYRVHRFSGDGTHMGQWGSIGTGNGQFKDSPLGVAVDSFGNVYVGDPGNQRVQKFRGNGTYVTQWGTYGSGNGEFDGPCAVAVDASGNVYVADAMNHRIQKFALANNSIAGTVTLSGQTDFSGVTVTADPGGHKARTAQDGSYRVGGLVPRTYQLTPQKTGWVFTSQKVTVPPSPADVDFTGQPARYSVAGKVTLAGGADPSGITVTSSPGGHHATTQADGSYKIKGLLAGNYTVKPSKQGWHFTGRAVTVPPSRAGISFWGTEVPTATALVTSLGAAPSRQGVSVTVGLLRSASIGVRALNLAGRPVRTLCRDRACSAGVSTLLWDARSDAGLPAPNGTYLVEVVARGSDGSQSRALVRVRMER
jgi:sugar lactone lactonase YvrE